MKRIVSIVNHLTLRQFKKILLYLLILFLLASAGIVTYVIYNKDKIIQAVVSEMNNYLRVEAKVGKIDLDLFDHWPYVAVQLENLSIRGNNCAIKPQLIQAKSISILVNPINLLRKNYEIQDLVIDQGTIHIFLDKLCRNYEIFKSDGTTEKTISLQNISLSDTRVQVHLPDLNQYYDLMAFNSKIGISIIGSKIDFSQKGNWQTDELKINNEDYAIPGKSQLQFDAHLDQSAKSFSFSNLEANMINANWIGEGTIHYASSGSSKLTIKTNEVSLADLSAAMPEKLSNSFKNYNPQAIVSLAYKMEGEFANLNASGHLEAKSNSLSFYSPEIETQFQIDGIDLLWEIEKLSDWKNSKLTIHSMAGSLDQSPFKASLSVNDFNRPFLEVEFFGTQSLKNVTRMIQMPLDTNLSGEIDFDISYRGYVSGSSGDLLKSSQFSGIVSLNNLDFTVLKPEVRIEGLRGQLAFNRDNLAIESLQGNAGSSDFKIGGSISNIIPYFFSENQKLYVDSRLESKYINLEDLITSGESDESYVLALPDKIVHRLETSIDRFKFKRFDAHNVRGEISLQNESLNLDSLNMDVSGGHIDISMNLDASNKDRIEWFTQGRMEGVYIDSVFYVFHNFNQDFIEQRHLEGQIYSDFTGFLISDDNLNFDHNKLIFSFDAAVKNGRLILFEPLQEVSRFTKESDLMNLSFDDLSNQIFIRDKTVTIPRMEIRSNVRTISVEGQHSFNNEIEYHLEIPLAAKKRDRDERFGVIEDPKTGKAKMLILIEGTTDDYNIKYDNQALKANIKSGLKSELQELKDLLKKKKKDEEEVLELDEDDFFDFN